MEENIKNYLNGVNYYDFQRYNCDKLYLELIDSWLTKEQDYINKTDKQFQELHQNLLFVFKDIAVNSFELFSAVLRVQENNNQAVNTFNNRLSHLNSGLDEILKISSMIGINMRIKQVTEAKTIQNLLIHSFDQFKDLLLNLGIDVDETPLKRKFKRVLKTITKKKIFEIEKTNQPQIKTKSNEDYTWFKIGLKFATGEVQEYIEKCKESEVELVYRKIAIDLGFKGTDRPYFSSTIANTVSDNKNIYKQPNKMVEIYNYCVKNGIRVVEDFKMHLPSDTI